MFEVGQVSFSFDHPIGAHNEKFGPYYAGPILIFNRRNVTDRPLSQCDTFGNLLNAGLHRKFTVSTVQGLLERPLDAVAYPSNYLFISYLADGYACVSGMSPLVQNVALGSLVSGL